MSHQADRRLQTGEGTKDKCTCNSEFTQKKTTDLRKKEEIIKEKSRPKQTFCGTNVISFSFEFKEPKMTTPHNNCQTNTTPQQPNATNKHTQRKTRRKFRA